jgi:hypothetical protein
MSISTLILDPVANGHAQVTPTRYPATITITFESEAPAEAFYGVDGQIPTIPLQQGVSKVVVNVNSVQLAYRTLKGKTKLQWEME